MVIQRSRAWVKERIPAFICKETNWWVSRWIQANVFFCPRCREEYRSLKQVWDCLDEWEEEPPSPRCELEFSEKFRQQFPSAFREEEVPASVLQSWYGKVGLVGGVLAVAMAFMFLTQTEPFQRERLDKTGGLLVAEQNRVEIPAPPPQVAQVSRDETQPTAVDGRIEQTIPDDLIPPEEALQLPGVQVRTVSLHSTPTRSRKHLDSEYSRHVVELNSHPVVGFSALSIQADEGAY